jgi:AcrR family transcriptional regulator
MGKGADRMADKLISDDESVESTGRTVAGRGARYEEIIRTSIDVFSRTNYEKATTALLARESGIAEGTMYRYFSSKKELFLECFRYVCGLLIDRYRAIYGETGDQPIEYLKRVTFSYIDFVRENPSMRRFLALILNNSFDEDFKRELEGFFLLNVMATERMLRKAQERGDISAQMDPRSAAWLFVGGYFSLILMTEIGAGDALDRGYLESVFQAILGIE